MKFFSIPRVDWSFLPGDPDGPFTAGSIYVVDLHNAPPEACPVGKVQAVCGRAAVAYIRKACKWAMKGVVDGIITAPINKAALHRAGVGHAGHTEFLKEMTGVDNAFMLLMAPEMRVIHVSTHISLREAINRLDEKTVLDAIKLGDRACRFLGITTPKIGVAGLNPHAGEDGLFGDEENQIIMPAIMSARAGGIRVSDPQPPDTVFLKASQGDYDLVVAMYHDQGHIPMKLLAFDTGVNVTVGLPIIRTSVDHGTAFDSAGSGKAKPDSLIAALRVAAKIARGKIRTG